MQGTPATNIIEGDLIIMTLTAKNKSGQPISLHATFDHEGYELNASEERVSDSPVLDFSEGPDQPPFDLAEFTRLIKANQKKEADQMTVAYKEALDEFNGGGGGLLVERIARAVYAYVQDAAGVRAEDHEGLVLKEDQVVVKAPIRMNGNPGVFVIQLAPVWG